jgi:ABC-type multidrug transport system ATPase subunit
VSAAAADAGAAGPVVVADPAVVVRGLTKRYGSVTAVDHVDLTVASGARLGLLGPNGSGKTTLVRMLLGLVYATSGEIEVLGESMPRHAATVLRRVGAMVEGPAAYGHLSGRKNLRLLDAAGPGGTRAGRDRRVDEVLELVGLHAGRRKVKAYSLGMRQRLGLAGALLHEPALLLLDEPTNGLDPTGIRELRDLLLLLNAEGTTVVLSSHLLSEVEALCTEVALMDHGRLAYSGPLDTLRPATGRVLVGTPDVARAATVLGPAVVARSEQGLVVTGADVAAINRTLVRAGVAVTSLEAERQSLEDVVTGLAPGDGR